MRKCVLTFTLLFSVLMSAQVTITMEKEGGVYKIPCKVNGAKLKMIFDSGASNVCLSEAIAEYLLENEYISKEDFIGVGSSSVADGRIVDHLRINLRDIEIEGLHLRNIEGVVIVGQKGALLLGQSAIQALGPVTINGNQLIIHNGNSQVSDSEIDLIREDAIRSMEAHNWREAIRQYIKLDRYGVADYFDLYSLTFALQMDDQYDRSGEVLERWFDYYEQYSTQSILYDMYSLYASYYRYKTRPEDAKAIGYLFKMQNMLTQLYGYKTTEYYYQDYYISKNIGACYFHMKSDNSAAKYYWQAMISYATSKQINVELAEKGKIKDENMGYCMYMYALCLADVYYSHAAMKMAARMGSKDAQTYCNSTGLDWNR